MEANPHVLSNLEASWEIRPYHMLITIYIESKILQGHPVNSKANFEIETWNISFTWTYLYRGGPWSNISFLEEVKYTENISRIKNQKADVRIGWILLSIFLNKNCFEVYIFLGIYLYLKGNLFAWHLWNFSVINFYEVKRCFIS